MPLSDLPWSPAQTYPQYHGTKRKLAQGDIVEQQGHYEESTAKRRCFLTDTCPSIAAGDGRRTDTPLCQGYLHTVQETSSLNLRPQPGMWCDNRGNQGVLSQDINSNSVTQANDLIHIDHLTQTYDLVLQDNNLAHQAHNLTAANLMEANNLAHANNLTHAQVFVQQAESQLTCTVISHGASGHSPDMPQENMIMDLNDEMYSTTQIDMYMTEDHAFSTMDSDCVPNPSQYNIQTSHNQCGPSGDHQPMSSISPVKCYCRPAWDASTDLQPYVSDYY